MPDRSSSPEAALLARLARLHRSEAAPAAARARFAENIARLEAAPRAAVRRPRPLRAAVWVPLAAMAAAALAWLLVRPERVTPLREPAPVPSAAQQISLSGVALPGTLRWRDGAASYDSNERQCLYRFSLQPRVVTDATPPSGPPARKSRAIRSGALRGTPGQREHSDVPTGSFGQGVDRAFAPQTLGPSGTPSGTTGTRPFRGEDPGLGTS